LVQYYLWLVGAFNGEAKKLAEMLVGIVSRAGWK
jgi:hypothetical protein